MTPKLLEWMVLPFITLGNQKEKMGLESRVMSSVIILRIRMSIGQQVPLSAGGRRWGDKVFVQHSGEWN